MATEENYITASCFIREHTIAKNGKTVFEKAQSNFADFLLSAYQNFDFKYPKFYKMDNLSKLGWLASEILLMDTFSKNIYKPDEVGIVLANSNASLDTDLKYFETTKDYASPSLFVYTLPNIVMGEICIRNHFKGENAFFVQEQFDVNFVQEYVKGLLEQDILQACIFGWVDTLQENHEAILFLVEKKKVADSIWFTKENIENILSKK